MRRNFFLLIAAWMMLSLGFVSCAEDTEVADPYADWQARNDHFLDSIVDVARRNADGKWRIYRNYKVQNDDSSIEGGIGGASVTNPYETPASEKDSVYMKAIEGPDVDGIAPLYTDSVYVYYRGSLINGTVFNETYQGELNTEIHTPVVFALQGSDGYGNLVDGLTNGWVTALQQMKEGERVMLYIPAELAYGDSGQDIIPGHSVLIFDIKLEKVVHPKGPDDRSRISEQAEEK